MASGLVHGNSEQLDDSRYEYFNGQVRDRPMPGDQHSDLQFYLRQHFSPLAQRIGAKVRQEWSLGKGNGEWLTPDVMMAKEPFSTTRRGHLLVPPAPLLVIEIRSVDQNVRTLFDKVADYRIIGVPNYWIIDPVERSCYSGMMQSAEISVRVWPQGQFLRISDLEVDEGILEISDMWRYMDGETSHPANLT